MHAINTARASIPTTYSLIMAVELGLQERSLGKLIAGCDLSIQQLTSDSTLLTAEQQVQIIHNALHIAGDNGFGLRLGKRLTPPTHGALGFLANSSPDLGTAIQAFEAFLPTRVSFVGIETAVNNQSFECHLKVDLKADDAIYRSVIEALSLSFISLVEFIIGHRLTEGELYLRGPAPHYQAIYDDLIPCPVHFSATHNKIVIPLSLLKSINATANHSSYTLALQQCELMLKQLPSAHKKTRHKVKTYMLTHPPEQISEERVAAALFITKRTLARRLEAEGASYRKLKEEIFSSLASRYLHDTNLSIEAIAAMLGYHDSANFRRAFKRWYSITPSRYREELLSAKEQ